jgi:pyrimidine operon attenuation protein/uracil phosphoribosyltransferase
MAASTERGSVALHDSGGVETLVARLADGLATVVASSSRPAIVGIRTRGLTLARRLHERLAARSPDPLPFGSLDITLYRDDLSTLGPQPVVGRTHLPFAVDGATVYLVDDVIFTGRTTRAAIDALLAYGRPAAIRLAVLVDRGHREYPIHPDVAALRLDTDFNQIVKVHFTEDDGTEGIDLVTP